MATRSDDLRIIRRLSQYRPFERGGQSARERKEDLILAGLAEAGGACTSIGDCAATIDTLWGLHYDDLELADPIAHLIAEKRMVRDSAGRLSLSGDERRRLDAAATASQQAARQAFEEWHAAVKARWPGVSPESLDLLDQTLEKFIYAVVQQHGAEATLLIYPEEPGARAIVESVDAKARALDHLDAEDLPRAEWALSMFMREATEAQRHYLSETLNTAYFVTALTLDPEGARLVQTITAGQRVYLDTNFVYRLLGVQGPRYVRAAEAILRATQAAGYVCAVTPWTVDEYRGSLSRSKDFLQRYPIPPHEFAALAADVTSVEDFVTSYWRQVKSTSLSLTDYVAFHSEVEEHLKQRGVAIVDEGVKAIDAQKDNVAAETTILVRVLAGKWRHPELVEHDAKHRLLVQRLRGSGNRNFSNAGYWFLTHDRVLPRYDLQAVRGASRATGPHLPFCVSAGAWFQVVEAFRAKTDDFGQTLADVISSPYIHPRSSISRDVAQAVVARVALYNGGTPELAARVFMNSAAMAEIESVEADEATAVIDNAIVAAAKDAQEEARLARQQADREREQALATAKAASARIADIEQERDRSVEAARRDADDARRDEASRAEEAARNEAAHQAAAAEAQTARHQAELEREQAKHRSALGSKEMELRLANERSSRLHRRQRMAVVFLLAAVAFTLVALAVGLNQAWAYVVGVAVVLGVVAAVDQLFKLRE